MRVDELDSTSPYFVAVHGVVAEKLKSNAPSRKLSDAVHSLISTGELSKDGLDVYLKALKMEYLQEADELPQSAGEGIKAYFRKCSDFYGQALTTPAFQSEICRSQARGFERQANDQKTKVNLLTILNILIKHKFILGMLNDGII